MWTRGRFVVLKDVGLGRMKVFSEEGGVWIAVENHEGKVED